jgi:hypothetical protein
MATNTGIGCDCSNCKSPRWYDRGVCCDCKRSDGITFTWLAKPKKGGGGAPEDPPGAVLELEPGIGAQLVAIWRHLLLVRGLTPRRRQLGGTVSGSRSPGWYRDRGIDFHTQLNRGSGPPVSVDQVHLAADWTNQSFVIRVTATFEAFAGNREWDFFRLPHTPGMREFHHARRLRNAIAHGDVLDASRLVDEENSLFRRGQTAVTCCSLDFEKVLEPLWARLLMYATHYERGATPLPADPAVVAAPFGASLVVQSFDRVREMPADRARQIGDIVQLVVGGP